MTPTALVLAGLLGREDAGRLCAQVRAYLDDTGVDRVVCDVGAVAGRGLGVVDVLARMELAARRAGGRIVVRNPPADLSELLRLVGLSLEFERETEEREPARGVQEAVESGDTAL